MRLKRQSGSDQRIEEGDSGTIKIEAISVAAAQTLDSNVAFVQSLAGRNSRSMVFTWRVEEDPRPDER